MGQLLELSCLLAHSVPDVWVKPCWILPTVHPSAEYCWVHLSATGSKRSPMTNLQNLRHGCFKPLSFDSVLVIYYYITNYPKFSDSGQPSSLIISQFLQIKHSWASWLGSYSMVYLMRSDIRQILLLLEGTFRLGGGKGRWVNGQLQRNWITPGTECGGGWERRSQDGDRFQDGLHWPPFQPFFCLRAEC